MPGQRFFSPFALTLILRQIAIIGIVGAAQPLVILTAGIDLSVGAVMIFSSVVMGKFTFDPDLPPAAGVICGPLLGLGLGAFSGFLVSVWRLPPFSVTLGMWRTVLAANFVNSGSEVIRSQDIAGHAPLPQFFGNKIGVGGAIFAMA